MLTYEEYFCDYCGDKNDESCPLVENIKGYFVCECCIDVEESNLEDSDLKIVLDYMLDYGGDGSLPNMDENESGDKAYEAALRLATEVGSKSNG